LPHKGGEELEEKPSLSRSKMRKRGIIIDGVFGGVGWASNGVGVGEN